MSVKRIFVAEKERTAGYTHVLLVTTGSVASIKASLIVSELLSVCVTYYLANARVCLPAIFWSLSGDLYAHHSYV